jgi:hypothetical protein
LRATVIAEETYADKMGVVDRGPSDFPAHVNASGLEQPRISYSKVNIYGHELPSRFPLGPAPHDALLPLFGGSMHQRSWQCFGEQWYNEVRTLFWKS